MFHTIITKKQALLKAKKKKMFNSNSSSIWLSEKVQVPLVITHDLNMASTSVILIKLNFTPFLEPDWLSVVSRPSNIVL